MILRTIKPYGVGLLLAAAALAGCTAIPKPRQATLPAPAPIATPRPQPAPQPAAAWIDAPITPGNWVYRQDARGSIALFGSPGAAALVTLRCERGASAIYLSRASEATSPTPMILRASTTQEARAAQPTGGTPPYMSVRFTPRDPLLDALAFSRGRFLVALEGATALPIPTAPELTRVIEDCR